MPHNPERRAWRGRSYRKGGERTVELKAAPEPEESTSALCETCGGEAILLGGLGKTNHYRCRLCGAEQSQSQ